jgi:hypothetical protein
MTSGNVAKAPQNTPSAAHWPALFEIVSFSPVKPRVSRLSTIFGATHQP